MSSGSAQDVAVEHFLRDIERRGNRLHCAVIGREGQNPHGDMNLLYRKSRLDWRHRDSDSNKKSSGSKDSSATVGKVRDLASFRRHFRMGFMTMPASQDLSPRPCSSAMAPRSQSCHSVGMGGDDMENGDHSSPQPSHHSSCRRPPAKPKRHPSTRLSSTADHRGASLPLPEAPPPLPPTQLPTKHHGKRNAMKKSDSGDMCGRKVPPLKPKRSPNTQLSFDPPPPRTAPPATPLPRPSQETGGHEQDEDEEPVYIEMVGRAFSRRDSQNATPHPATATTTPDSDSDESEAIYEEMKYPLPEESEPRHRLPPKHDKPGASKSSKIAHSSASHSSSSSHTHQSSSSSSKPKATVSISHSSPLPSSTSSTPVPQALASGPHQPRAPTPFLLPGSKSQGESSNKIPAPFPNLLQHRPPLLAFPQPAAASSGIGVQIKAAGAKLGTVSTQASTSLAPATNASSSTASTSSSSKLPVLQLGSKEASGASSAQQDKQQSEGKDSLLGPAPGLRARSHSTPLPPSSQSSSHYAHYHHHSHHHPSHYHHYRRAEKELPTSHSMKLGPQTTAQAQTQTQGSGGKEGKSVAFLLKSEKRERDRERERERETGAHSTTPSQNTPMTTPSASTPQSSAPSAPSPAPAPHSSSSQRPSSRPHLYRSHTPHPLSHGLPAYHPPPPDSPMLWTYPSVGLKRPPAYDSLRGGQLHSPHPQITSLSSGGNIPKSSSAPAPHQQGKAVGRGCHVDTGSLSRDGSGGMGSMDEGPYWPMQRKMSFSHGIRETEKEESSRVWNGSTDALPRVDKEDRGVLGGPGGLSGIPVRSGDGSSGGSGEGTGGAGPSTGLRALGRSGLPLPCQTFPACHRNGELGRLGRSASTSGVRQVSSNMQRQCSLPREALSQVQGHAQSQPPCTPTISHQQQQLQLHQQQLQQQQLQQQIHLQLHYQHLAHLSQCHPPSSGGATSQAQAQTQRDGKLLEVIERKRCLCKEIKAHRRPERSLCKQDSMPILPSWRRTPEPRKTGTPPCQRQQAVVWDTAI
ncbi:hypothetical protein AAFF_G00324730 [Aldrovandia affinis]|uniref:Neuronal tyrosine-phosphorylated phosphoinositide-3-kinase adapter 1 n=1 Tax=Aldrovandia affinis TaxID=143900 RepID=A0AAD7X197_9TELE|nr:hypothetical protein AAFF_G00324730 [Aldrovandia affinis]